MNRSSDSRGVDEIDASESHRGQPHPAEGDCRTNSSDEYAGVDGVADEAVRSARNELRFDLPRHWSTQLRPMCSRAQTAKPNPSREEDESGAGAPWVASEAVVAKRPTHV